MQTAEDKQLAIAQLIAARRIEAQQQIRDLDEAIDRATNQMGREGAGRERDRWEWYEGQLMKLDNDVKAILDS